MQVVHPGGFENLYPISRQGWDSDRKILGHYESVMVRGIENRYDTLLDPTDPTRFLHNFGARPYLKDERFPEEQAAYKLGITAARIVINHKLIELTGDTVNINHLKLQSENQAPIDFAKLGLKRFILAPLYPRPVSNREPTDIKDEIHRAVDHITPSATPHANDWLVVGMGDTHAVYSRLWNPLAELQTIDLNPNDPVLSKSHDDR